jgi:hypothetical protein
MAAVVRYLMKIETFRTSTMLVIIVVVAIINTTKVSKVNEWSKNGLTMVLLGIFMSVWLVSSILKNEITARGCAIDKTKNPALYIIILTVFFIFSLFLFYAGFMMLTGK